MDTASLPFTTMSERHACYSDLNYLIKNVRNAVKNAKKLHGEQRLFQHTAGPIENALRLLNDCWSLLEYYQVSLPLSSLEPLHQRARQKLEQLYEDIESPSLLQIYSDCLLHDQNLSENQALFLSTQIDSLRSHGFLQTENNNKNSKKSS